MSKRRNRFVVPETVRIDLSDGDWIEVKRELSWGEQKDLENSAVGNMSGIVPGSKDTSNLGMGLALGEFEINRLFTWIVDWSFVDENDKSAEITLDSIRALRQGDAEEISDALSAHIEAQEDSKNPPTEG